MRYRDLGTARNIVKSCCILHNIAIDQKDELPTVFAEGFLESIQQTQIQANFHFGRAGQPTVRDTLMNTYFAPMVANANPLDVDF